VYSSVRYNISIVAHAVVSFEQRIAFCQAFPTDMKGSPPFQKSSADGVYLRCIPIQKNKQNPMAELEPLRFELGLDLEDTHVLVTGGKGHIGSVAVAAFVAAGAKVSSLDYLYDAHTNTEPDVIETADGKGRLQQIQCDITDTASMTRAWDAAARRFGVVESCIALAGRDLSALEQTESLCDVDAASWLQVLQTNVGGTFLTAQLWLRGIRNHVGSSSTTSLRNPGLILIGSEAGHFGVRTNAAYAASKSAIQGGLLQSLRADAPRIHPRARVNAVAPGPVETTAFHDETGGPGTKEWWTECEATTALRKPVATESVARSLLFLASERWSANVHGQVLNVDSGKQGAVMWPPQSDGQRHKVLSDG